MYVRDYSKLAQEVKEKCRAKCFPSNYEYWISQYIYVKYRKFFNEIKKEGVVCCTLSELITTIKVRYVLGYVKLQVETHNLTNNNYLIPEASIPQNEGWK